MNIFEISSTTCCGEAAEISVRELYNRISSEIYPVAKPKSFLRLLFTEAEPAHTLDASMVAQKLRIRDVRKMDFSYNQTESFAIKVRMHCILLIVDPVRVIITASSIIIVVPPNGEKFVSILLAHVKDWATLRLEVEAHYKRNLAAVDVSDSQSDAVVAHPFAPASLTPFEVHCYEAVLSTVLDIQKIEIDDLTAQLKSTCGKLKNGMFMVMKVQEQFRELKLSVTRADYKYSLYRKAFSSLLENEKLLAVLSLTEFKKDPNLYRSPLSPKILMTHDFIEDVLQPYLIDMSSICAGLGELKSQLTVTEQYVSLRLSIMENKSLAAGTVLQIVGCSILVGNVVVGAGGMNLDVPADHGSFVVVCLVSFACIVFTFSSFMKMYENIIVLMM